MKYWFNECECFKIFLFPCSDPTPTTIDTANDEEIECISVDSSEYSNESDNESEGKVLKLIMLVLLIEIFLNKAYFFYFSRFWWI